MEARVDRRPQKCSTSLQIQWPRPRLSGNFSSTPGRLGVQAELVMVAKKHHGHGIAQRRDKRTQRVCSTSSSLCRHSSGRRVTALTSRSAGE